MAGKKTKFIITNMITLIRVVGIFALIPVFYNYGGFPTFVIVVLCFLTDALDGFLARHFEVSTFFGSFLDGISDKAFIVVNLILITWITKLAIIPIILEIIIVVMQLIKFENNLNVQANKIGKLKMWIAGIVISLCYLLSDKAFLASIGINISINNILLYSILLIPLVISQLITLASYVFEYNMEKETRRIDDKKDRERIKKEVENRSLIDVLLDHEFYIKYKDKSNLKFIKSLVDKN